jgi:hypothetical protein
MCNWPLQSASSSSNNLQVSDTGSKNQSMLVWIVAVFSAGVDQLHAKLPLNVENVNGLGTRRAIALGVQPPTALL